MCSTIKSIYKKYQHDKPEIIIWHIKDFFIKEGEAYRRGLLSEEEFLISTHYDLIYKDLWSLKNHLYVDEKHLQNTTFMSSWEEWKKTGLVNTSNKWFFDVCSQNGNPIESLRWFFQVIDALLIPTSYFMGIQNVEEFPNIIFCVDKDTVSLMLDEICIDAEMFQRTSFRLGDRITLNFYGGDVVNLIITEIHDSKIVGQGIVRDYMNSPGRIVIQLNRNGQNLDVYFNEKHFSRYEILMGTFMYQIPHPKWQNYNVERLSRALRIETEYKILRLPYMLGCENTIVTRESQKTAGKEVLKQSKIIPLHGNNIDYHFHD